MFRNSKEPLTEETVPHLPVPQQLLVALGILLLVFGTTYIGTIAAFFSPKNPTPQKEAATTEQVQTQQHHQQDPFLGVNVTAKAAYVWDVTNQRALFNKNADEQLPLASVTKLMTVLVANEIMKPGTPITITARAIKQDGDSGLSDGEVFSLQDLTDLTLISSSNDGAYALAAAAGSTLTTTGDAPKTFVDAMNIRAKELGLSQTYYKNPTGLDMSQTEAGAFGSARDMAFLMEYIITKHPDIISLTRDGQKTIADESGTEHTVDNTNESIGQIPGLIASKTGYTDLAGGNLVVAFDAGLNHPIIVSVLGSTFEGRFNDVVELIKRAQQYVTQTN
jgi:D-alanyl-D-alanine carboxypeptidase (penicillin-binding protein 5/6)